MSTSEPENHRPLGQGMLTIAWVIGLGILVWAFGSWEKDQLNPNKELRSTVSDRFIEVTLSANRQHGYVFSGHINGQEVVFLLDTGATDVVVSKQLADTLDLRYGAHGFAYTANGTVDVWDTTLKSVKLGPIHLQNVNASINPAMSGNEVLLGMTALRQLEIVQRDSQLTLRQPLQ